MERKKKVYLSDFWSNHKKKKKKTFSNWTFLNTKSVTGLIEGREEKRKELYNLIGRTRSWIWLGFAVMFHIKIWQSIPEFFWVPKKHRTCNKTIQQIKQMKISPITSKALYAHNNGKMLKLQLSTISNIQYNPVWSLGWIVNDKKKS